MTYLNRTTLRSENNHSTNVPLLIVKIIFLQETLILFFFQKFTFHHIFRESTHFSLKLRPRSLRYRSCAGTRFWNFSVSFNQV